MSPPFQKWINLLGRMWEEGQTTITGRIKNVCITHLGSISHVMYTK